MSRNSSNAQNKQQLALDLRSPATHYDLIAGSQQRQLIAWTPLAKTHWHKLNVDIARDQLSAWVSEPDVFVTPNEFNGWRLIKLGDGLNALYVDIDAHHQSTTDFSKLASAAISKIEAAQIPSPNFVVYTGRGIHLYWLIDRVPFSALPRWQACQRHLVKLLDADKMSADATRVLRVIGTTNSKTGSQVRAEMLTPKRYDFDWLADQVLPVTRAEIRDLRAARGCKPKSTKFSDFQKYPSQDGFQINQWTLVSEYVVPKEMQVLPCCR